MMVSDEGLKVVSSSEWNEAKARRRFTVIRTLQYEYEGASVLVSNMIW